MSQVLSVKGNSVKKGGIRWCMCQIGNLWTLGKSNQRNGVFAVEATHSRSKSTFRDLALGTGDTRESLLSGEKFLFQTAIIYLAFISTGLNF